MTKLDSPENRLYPNIDNPETKTLREFEKRKDGSTLNAFGKILDSFIIESGLTPDKSKGAESLKKNYIAQASGILNDATLNEVGKNTALQKLFGTFKENKEFFPTPTEQLQSGESEQIQYEKSKDDFYEKFLKSLAEQDAERTGNNQQKSKKLKIAGNEFTGIDNPPYGNFLSVQLDRDIENV